MEGNKKRSGDSVKTASPKKQKTSSKAQSGKNKKPVDANKPKRPKSAFLLFMDDFRVTFAEQAKKNGEPVSTRIGDVAKAGGEAWRNMTDKEKERYVIRYQETKKVYDEKMKGWKPVRDESKPKKPMTSFLLYLEGQRPKLKETLQGSAVAKKAGDLWSKMSDAEKKPFINRQHELKKQYDKDMKEYVLKNPPPPPQKKVTKSAKSKVKVQEVSESEEDDDEGEAEEESGDDDNDDEEESD